jgi:hypothetical protein
MWVKMDDKLHEHEAIHDLLEDGHLAALGMYFVAAAWCGDNFETDGAIAPFVLARFHPDWREYADQLVAAGLWAPTEVRGRPGFQFVDWSNDKNGLISCDSSAVIFARRHDDSIRKMVYSDPALVAAIKLRDQDRCRYCGCLVKWSDRRSTTGGTFDHVRPLRPTDGGRPGQNTLDNLVVCCRGCNGRKGNRTLREAGMRRLAPGAMGAPDFNDPDEDGTSDRGIAGGSGRFGSDRVGDQEGPSSGPRSEYDTKGHAQVLIDAAAPEGDDQ